MKHITTIILFVTFLFVPANARVWSEDVLGDGYQNTTIEQADDYSGKVVMTIVRKLSLPNVKTAVLYIHGFNDYFFQREMGDRFVDSCYNFYAVDLRKYGRSLREGQRPYEARNIKEYYADIDSAMSVINEDGNDNVIMVAHSTGGLIATSYLNECGAHEIRGLILNSPFLEWNMNGFMRKVILPTVSFIGSIIPKLAISQGDGTGYAESLLKEYHGEWTFDTEWKTIHPRKVTAGWIRCISRAQKNIKKKSAIKVPILLMHSDNSVSGSKWTEDFQNGDAVLNVNDISKYGTHLGNNVEEVTIAEGMHDLVLSKCEVREQVYKTMFDWLRKQGL